MHHSSIFGVQFFKNMASIHSIDTQNHLHINFGIEIALTNTIIGEIKLMT